TRIHIKAGCDPITGDVCVIDGDYDGTLTAELAGSIVFPDTDGDGVLDQNDNCKFVPNPTQTPVATPIVTPPAALTINSCLDHQIGGAIASDVCDASLVTITNNAPARFNAGANVVTWT